MREKTTLHNFHHKFHFNFHYLVYYFFIRILNVREKHWRKKTVFVQQEQRQALPYRSKKKICASTMITTSQNVKWLWERFPLHQQTKKISLVVWCVPNARAMRKKNAESYGKTNHHINLIYFLLLGRGRKENCSRQPTGTIINCVNSIKPFISVYDRQAEMWRNLS